MNNKIIAAVAIVCLVFSACKRDSLENSEIQNSDNPTPQNVEIKDLVAPAGFKFNTNKQLKINVKVADISSSERFGIKVYADEPSTGKLVSTGVTDAKGEYSNEITVPAWCEFVYIEKIDINGNSTFEKVAAKQFTSTIFKSSGNGVKPYTLKRKTNSGLDCVNGCPTIVNNPSGSYNVASGDTICFTGTLNNVSLTVQGNGVAKICGQGTLSYLGVSGLLLVLEGAIVKVQTTPSIYGHIINWSDSLVFENPLRIFTFDNVGNCYTKDLSTDGKLFNYGNLIVDGDFKFLGYSLRTENYGYFKTTGNFISYPITHLRNNCIFDIGKTLAVSGNFYMDNGYAKVGEKFLAGQYFGSTTIPAQFSQVTDIVNQSLISTKDLEFRNAGRLSGSANSRIKVTGNTSLLSGNFYGVKICDANGVETNAINAPSSQFTCSGTIPTSPCNPEGFGLISGDADGDGVGDSFDEYPNDAARAFNNYYPSANTTATLAFEDLWPAAGDYDFNDLIIAFNIQQVLTPSNEVLEYKVKLKIKAIGGSYVNGFGFQLDELTPAEINTITGQVLTQNAILLNANNTETVQDKAVVICYDSPEPLINRVGGSMFNTVKTNGAGTSDTVRININFNTPIPTSKLTIDKFNPFIYSNQRRHHEIHLVDFEPTDRMDMKLFATLSDRSPIWLNQYYKGVNGLPWAIVIPENFAYPKEKVAITSAYNFFDDWVLSNGGAYTNWFTNTIGNKNEAEVY